MRPTLSKRKIFDDDEVLVELRNDFKLLNNPVSIAWSIKGASGIIICSNL